MFRKLYWVTESVDQAGISHVTGVYTSIPDLVRHGIQSNEISSNLRLTLTKLDSNKEPLGTWSSPHFDGLSEALQTFVETDEFSAEQVQMLVSTLKQKVQLIYAA